MLPILLLGSGAFALTTADNRTETLFPATDRKATVVYVVLAECPIARQFSPEMARIAKTYGQRGIHFVMAFADGKPNEMKSQMKAFGLPFVAAKADQRLIQFLSAKTAPTAAIVGADGKLAYVGRIDDRFPSLGVQRKPRRSDLRLALDQFLTGKPVATPRTEVVGCILPSS